jgi:3-methyl-2-oxobutanoate hydroxymethyltransferase
VFALVLEILVPELAAEITRKLDIPTIGIGSGPGCAGQVLVVNDLLGFGLRKAPSFATPRADLAGVIGQAVGEYVAEVKAQPGARAKGPVLV